MRIWVSDLEGGNACHLPLSFAYFSSKLVIWDERLKKNVKFGGFVLENAMIAFQPNKPKKCSDEVVP